MLVVVCAVFARAQAPVAALRAGGFVLVIRHATAPREAPAPDSAAPGHQTVERQLDARGRADATALGDALRRLKIPIGTVLTSPAFRAIETVRYARLDGYTAVEELGDNGRSMQGVTDAQADWLRRTVAQV